MNLPNLKEARKRTTEKTNIKRDEYIISDKVKNIGHHKKYYIFY